MDYMVTNLLYNSNGLLRQYFPKGMALTEINQEQVQYAVDRLNHRPRKVLDFKTPFEIFFGKTMRYTKSTLTVALLNGIHHVLNDHSGQLSRASRSVFYHVSPRLAVSRAGS